MARVLTFRFDTFGDVTTASSRLRAWKLGEFLASSGHRVSMNEGEPCDVYVCQKVRPFATLRALREAGALVVYDFDDHLLLEGVESHGVKDEVIAFINAADVVTVGSEYLAEAARKFHRNVFVLENPVDIGSAALVRGKTAELKRIGWFGTSAGLVDLRGVKTAERIETVTRGGDIEFDLKSIDRTLTGFDLLLLPVELNRWNLAKNANRMVKAVALGVPVLATATPAHLAAANRLGLDERFLVREGETWDGNIAALREDFNAVQDAVLRARENAIGSFSIQLIGGDWLRHIERALDRKASATSSESAGEALKEVALLGLAYGADQQPASAERAGGIAFGSRHVVAPEASGDYLELFDALWETVASIEQEWVLFQPQGFHPTLGFAGEVKRALRHEPHVQFLLVRSQQPGFPADEWAAYAKDLRATLCKPRDPGMVLVRRSWLMHQPWRPGECFSYWTWIMLVQALSEGVTGVVSTPVVLRNKDPAITNICAEYASSATLYAERPVELPYPDVQWRRLSIDVLALLAERLPVPVSAAFAWLASDLQTAPNANGSTSIDALGRVEQELRGVYASASWRLTQPLRAAAKIARRIGARSRALRP
jgi:hypothetical protein